MIIITIKELINDMKSTEGRKRKEDEEEEATEEKKESKTREGMRKDEE